MWGALLNDFAGPQGWVNDALRLSRGQSIDSGLVEGSIKPLLNVRLKQAGARRKVEHVASLVELRDLAAGPEWETFWKQTGPDAKIERGNLRDRGPVVSGVAASQFVGLSGGADDLRIQSSSHGDFVRGVASPGKKRDG